MNFGSAKEAMDHGFAMITEERKANGLFLKGDLTFNTTIANLNHYKSGIALSDSKMTKATAKEIKVMHTKCMGPGRHDHQSFRRKSAEGDLRKMAGAPASGLYDGRAYTEV